MKNSRNTSSSSRPGMIKRMGRGERRRRRKRIIQITGIAAAVAITGITAATLAPRVLLHQNRGAERPAEGKTIIREPAVQPQEATAKPAGFAAETSPQRAPTGPGTARRSATLELPASLREDADPWGPLELDADESSYIWSRNGAASGDPSDEFVVIAPAPAADEAPRNPLVRIERKLAKAQAFLAATTLEEKLAHARDPAAARPLLQAFFADREGGIETSLALAFQRLFPMDDVALPGMGRNGDEFRYRNFAVLFRDGSRRLLPVVELDDSRGLAVDVPAFLRSGSGTVFRVFVAEDDYYNFSYNDPGKWRCYRLSNPDWEDNYFAYARRDSPADHQLRMLLGIDTRDVVRPATGEPRNADTLPDEPFSSAFGGALPAPAHWSDANAPLIGGSAMRERRATSADTRADQSQPARAIVKIVPGNEGKFPERRQVEIARFIQRGWVQP